MSAEVQNNDKIQSTQQPEGGKESKFTSWIKGIFKAKDQSVTSTDPIKDQTNHRGDGLAKYTESTIKYNSEKLSKEEAIEKSWEFLNEITERVAVLPEDLQMKIISEGKRLMSAGAGYNHTVDTSSRVPKSPAKEAARKHAELNK